LTAFFKNILPVAGRRYLYKRILLCCLLFELCFAGEKTVLAQNNDYIFRHVTTENGLVNMSVKFIMQDSRGYMWIGCQTGLQRYDGYRFVTYTADFHNPQGLQTDWISTIFEDSRHRFWIGTDDGSVYTLDRNTGKFYNYNLYEGSEKNKITGVWQICEDGNKDLWVSAHNGIFKLNNNNNRFENKNAEFSIGDKLKATGITRDNTGNIWIGTTGGIKFYDINHHTIWDKNYNPLNNPLFNIGIGVAEVTFDSSHNIWANCGYEHVLYRYNLVTKKLSAYYFPKKNAKDITSPPEVVDVAYVTDRGQFIVSIIAKGLAVYNGHDDDFESIYANNQSPLGLHLDPDLYASTCISSDIENNIWVGTDQGINIYNPARQVFSNYGGVSGKTISNNFSPYPVNTFFQSPDNGDIYVPYYFPRGGVNRYDSNLNFKAHYALANEKPPYWKNEVWYIYQDNNGILWAPNQDGSILKINTQTGVTIDTDDKTLDGNINEIERDENGDVWICYWKKGLTKIDHKTGKATAYNQSSMAGAPGVKNVAGVLFEPGNKMWVAGRNEGLWLFDRTKGAYIESYTVNEKNKTSISSNRISGMIAYNSDTLILATLSGLNIFDKHKKTFTIISAKDGLPDNLVVAVALDRHKDLWVCCVSGICKINIPTGVITNYDITDGVPQNEFTGAFLQLKNGQMLAACSKGFIMFNPDSVVSAKPPQDVTITGFYVFGKRLDSGVTNNINNTVPLSYTENSVRIEFATLQFTSTGKTKYYYQLDGVDKNWIIAGKEQFANYNQLHSGNYIFKIKAANRDGVFSKDVTLLYIQIIPPFWQRWWFITLNILLCIALAGAFIKWREKNIKALEAGKTKVQELTAEQYKNQLELEQITNFFSTSLINKHNIDEVLWDVAGNLIGKLGFVDCMIYLWNSDKTKLVQKAGYGPKGSLEEINKQPFDVVPGQGVVGYVALTGEAVIIPDTTKDSRYRVDEMSRLSEICVPITYDEELLGIIDSEHYEKNFFTRRHMQIITTIASLVAGKIKSFESQSALQQRKEEIDNIQQQLAQVQLAALRSQMNPHFIFNSLNSINTFILQNDQENASEYLNKFSQLMRIILDNSRSEWVQLENELKALQLYMELESLRFENVFTYDINVSTDIPLARVLLPPLIIQPYVENAIWHGLMHRKKPGGKIMIEVYKENGLLLIMIEDNGVGREWAASLQMKKSPLRRSHGMKITEERLAIANNVYNANARVSVTDLNDVQTKASGTRVLLTIQYKTNEGYTD